MGFELCPCEGLNKGKRFKLVGTGVWRAHRATCSGMHTDYCFCSPQRSSAALWLGQQVQGLALGLVGPAPMATGPVLSLGLMAYWLGAVSLAVGTAPLVERPKPGWAVQVNSRMSQGRPQLWAYPPRKPWDEVTSWFSSTGPTLVSLDSLPQEIPLSYLSPSPSCFFANAMSFFPSASLP